MPKLNDEIQILNSKIDGLERYLHDSTRKRASSESWRNVWIPLLSLVIAVVSILTGAYLQYNGLLVQEKMNQYQVTFNAKQQGYAKFMALLEESFGNALTGKKAELISSEDQLQNAYYEIDPFLSENMRNPIWNDMMVFVEICDQTDMAYGSGVSNLSFIKSYTAQRDKIKQEIRKELFGN